jgi:hypothetical protein
MSLVTPQGNQTGLKQEKYLAIKQAKQKSFRWRNLQQKGVFRRNVVPSS